MTSYLLIYLSGVLFTSFLLALALGDGMTEYERWYLGAVVFLWPLVLPIICAMALGRFLHERIHAKSGGE